MSKRCSSVSRSNSARYHWLSMPLFGAARISQAIAPRNGGVTNEAVTSARIAPRNGMSVRATSQASGSATMHEASATLAAIPSAVRNGATKLGSLASWTKLASVGAPLSSVTLYQTSHSSGSSTSAQRNRPSAPSSGSEGSKRSRPRPRDVVGAAVAAVSRSPRKTRGSASQRAAAVGREAQAHRAADGDVELHRRDDPHLLAAAQGHEIVAAGAEIGLA